MTAAMNFSRLAVEVADEQFRQAMMLPCRQHREPVRAAAAEPNARRLPAMPRPGVATPSRSSPPANSVRMKNRTAWRSTYS